MIAPLPFTLYQGVRYDHSSVAASLDGVFYLIKSLSFEDGLDPAVVYANSSIPLGFTRGQLKATGSVELWTAEANLFVQNLYRSQVVPTGAEKAGLLEIIFPITFLYKEEGGLDQYKTVLNGCRIVKRTRQSAIGNEAHYVKFDLAILNVMDGGIPSVAGLEFVAETY